MSIILPALRGIPGSVVMIPPSGDQLTYTIAPQISGSAIVGATCSIIAANWSGPYDLLERTIIDTADDSTIEAWTAIDNDGDFVIPDLDGITIRCGERVTKDSVVSEVAWSNDFGPLVATHELSLGLVFWTTDQGTVPGSWPWTEVVGGSPHTTYAYPQSNPNIPGKSWGINTSSLVSAQTAATDMRLKGRWAGNTGIGASNIRIDLPAGDYEFYCGFHVSSVVVNCNLEVRQTTTGGTQIINIPPASLVSAANVRDALGQVTDLATWQGASDFGGDPATFTLASDDSIFIGRSATGGSSSPFFCCLAVVKVNS